MTTLTSFNYNNAIDSTNALQASRELVSVLGIDAAQNITVPDQKNITFSSSFPGYTRDDMATMEQVFQSMDKQYAEMLQDVKATNDMLNMHDYVQNIYDSESGRVNHLRNQSVNNVYKLREGYMTQKYSVYYNQYLTRIIMMTLGVAIVCACLGLCAYSRDPPMLDKAIAACVGLVILIFYVLVLGLSYHRTLERRKDDWTKYYFKAPPGVEGANSCGA